MALIVVEENAGPGVDYTDVATAVTNAGINDKVQIQGPWSSPDPGGNIHNNKSGLTIEAVGDAATKGVVDEVSGTYWRLIYSGTQHAFESVADGITLRGLTIKVDHTNNDKHAIHCRATITLEDSVIYGQSSSFAADQHGLSFEPNILNYIINVSNCLFFRLKGAGIVTEHVSGNPMGGAARIRGCTFAYLDYGIRRIGAVDENEIFHFLHSNNFMFCTGPLSESTSIFPTISVGSATLFLDNFYVDNCISDDSRTVNGSYFSNVNCLASQSVSEIDTSTGMLLEDVTTYPYDFRPIAAAGGGDNVLVDHHASMTAIQGGIPNPLQTIGLGDVLRQPAAVDVGAFELPIDAIDISGDVVQDLPFMDQAAQGVTNVMTATVETTGPFVDQDLVGQDIASSDVDVTLPFVDQDLIGQVVIQISGASDYVLPFIDQDLAGLVESDLDGDITQDLPFIDQDLEGAGFRIFSVDTTAPFIEQVAGSTTVASGNVTETLPFVDQDAAGTVTTVTQIVQDLPFVDQNAIGDVTVQGDVVQDLPFVDQLLEDPTVWSAAIVNSDAPFIEQDLISTSDVIGDIDQDLPFLETEDEPGKIRQTLPFFDIEMEGETAASEGDIVQDLPFIEQDASGGLTPPIAGDIDKQQLPFIFQCGEGRVVRGIDIDQALPFIENTAAGEINVVGDNVQNLPFVDLALRGAGSLAEDWLTRNCTLTLFVTSQADLRSLDFVPAERRLEFSPVRRELVPICANYDPDDTEFVSVGWQLMSGEFVEDLDGNLFEFLVEG